jgi:hypothetical protein
MPHHRDEITPRMQDDWRLQVDLDLTGHADALSAILEAHRLDHDLSEEFSDRLIVSRNGPRLFLYAATEEQIEGAREALELEAQRQHWTVKTDLRRWHRIEEEWVTPDVAMPGDDATRRAEREKLMNREKEETEKRGYPEFEVRVTLPSHREANALAERLREEGELVVKRWRFLVIGATDEDSAKALADKIRAEAPPDSKTEVEGTIQALRADTKIARGPFSVFE